MKLPDVSFVCTELNMSLDTLVHLTGRLHMSAIEKLWKGNEKIIRSHVRMGWFMEFWSTYDTLETTEGCMTTDINAYQRHNLQYRTKAEKNELNKTESWIKYFGLEFDY